ncbi:MAG: nucleoside triphosphate pyrophosphohydrolase [Clostridia bacterium]|nr:nucleoside triphosphate pyrophosphohydrolase [Clostridia bacterium]
MENIKQVISGLLAKENYTFDDLCTIMVILRSEEGCPWDREQTHRSIRQNFIEETYEVIEAIDTENPDLLREELGDVLLQVIFHARMEEEAGRFAIDDVTNDICAKLIHRHPHIFGAVKADTTDEVLANWEAIKAAEKARVTVSDKLRSIPPMLPALMRAEKVGKKSDLDAADGAGDAAEALASLTAAVQALEGADEADRERRLGELLFAAVTAGRKLGLEAETALTHETDRRIADYSAYEAAITANPDANRTEIWKSLRKK